MPWMGYQNSRFSTLTQFSIRPIEGQIVTPKEGIKHLVIYSRRSFRQERKTGK
ncbi:hypothetical protein LMG33818_000859 [Halomonadaceae bacterium LMG 33818]